MRLPIVPEYAEHPSHLFYLVMPSATDRHNLIRDLERANIHASSIMYHCTHRLWVRRSGLINSLVRSPRTLANDF